MDAHKEMVSMLTKDGVDIITDLTSESAHLLHMAVGVSGEVDELIENFIDNGSFENKVEELGDIEFYFEGIASVLELDTEVTARDAVLTDSVSHQLLQFRVRAGNLLDLVKKHAIYAKPLDTNLIINQMWLVRKSLCNLYYMWNIYRKTALEANIAKLAVRYEGMKYSNNAAQNRADKIK